VSARADIIIAATEREIWTVIADIASWPTWNPAVREAVVQDELEVGARFRFSTPFGRLTCRVTQVDAPRTLAWTGRVLTVAQRQVWQVDGRPAGAHVVTEATMTGPGARLFKRRLNERLQGEVDAAVQLLKLEAEARSAEEREGP
jgi:hypothetical protein